MTKFRTNTIIQYTLSIESSMSHYAVSNTVKRYVHSVNLSKDNVCQQTSKASNHYNMFIDRQNYLRKFENHCTDSLSVQLMEITAMFIITTHLALSETQNTCCRSSQSSLHCNVYKMKQKLHVAIVLHTKYEPRFLLVYTGNSHRMSSVRM